MNYLEYGDESDDVVMLIHGVASTARSCYADVVKPLTQAGYCVVLVEVDGHIEDDPGDFTSLAAACDDVEAYVQRELGGELWCLGGFSMGATMAVEIAGRANLHINRLFLDAALTVPLKASASVFSFLFRYGVRRLQAGKIIPDALLATCMGKGNRSVIEMFYPGTSQATIANLFRDLRDYQIPEGLRGYRGPVTFWRGSEEPYPAKSARQLKGYLPQMEERVFPNRGHGQQLHEHPQEYSAGLLEFLAASQD